MVGGVEWGAGREKRLSIRFYGNGLLDSGVKFSMQSTAAENTAGAPVRLDYHSIAADVDRGLAGQAKLYMTENSCKTSPALIGALAQSTDQSNINRWAGMQHDH